MTEEFNLSKKIVKNVGVFNADALGVADVKEFIQKLEDFEWQVGALESNGVTRKIKESEVARFMDYLKNLAGKDLK